MLRPELGAGDGGHVLAQLEPLHLEAVPEVAEVLTGAAGHVEEGAGLRAAAPAPPR